MGAVVYPHRERIWREDVTSGATWQGGDHVAGEDQDKGDLILTDRGFVYSLSWLLSLAKSMVVAPS